MKCMEIRLNKLFLTDRERPKPQKGEVLIKVHAAGINRPDILQRRGIYPAPEGVTDIPGLEVSGEIYELGKNANSDRSGLPNLKKGMKVVALVSGGGYAEYCIAPAAQCLPVPSGMDMEVAAGIPETFFSVWYNLFEIAKMKKGETLLLHGASSGIGTTAIQIAKARGIKVFVTSGTEEKCQRARKMGADLAINYQTQDFVEEVMKATKNIGVDVVLDIIGGDYFKRNIQALKIGGTYLSIAAQHGNAVELDLFEIMRKRILLTGSMLRPQDAKVKANIARALYKNIWPLMDERNTFTALFSKKRIAPVFDKDFLLSDAQSAHDYLDSGTHFGKVVLRVL